VSDEEGNRLMVVGVQVGGGGFKKRRMCDVRERGGKSEVDRVWRMN